MFDDKQNGETFAIREVGRLSVAKLTSTLVLFGLQVLSVTTATVPSPLPRLSTKIYQPARRRPKLELTGKISTPDGHANIRAEDISGLSRLANLIMAKPAALIRSG